MQSNYYSHAINLHNLMTVRSLKTSNRPFTICIFGSTPEFFELNYKVAGSMSTTSSTIFIIDDDKVDVYGTCLRH